ncbi:MAG: hypothetical protein RE468_08885 [Acidithiobacillus caldus]|uniref:hypothetical protein n=1 Tax=Acidithiobacillus caldus TaxID=33059 RepID=UPI002815B93B|nr:hypothetical protein [Acidithiobacillus caldus]WMT46023.1 MAG: hypothetical protein RE468_08885 [Acidithiobacillus caldus]
MSQNFQRFFKNLDFSAVCAHARHYHGVSALEILGESWLAENSGLTQKQLFSRLRREYAPTFSHKKISEFYEILTQYEDPLENLDNLEDGKCCAKYPEILGEADSRELAQRLKISIRRAQQLIKKRKTAIVHTHSGKPAQLELFDLRGDA